MKRMAVLLAFALAIAACADDVEPAADDSDREPVVEDEPISVPAAPEEPIDPVAAVVLRGPIASVDRVGEELRACRSVRPLGCFDSIVLRGVDWSDVPGTRWTEVWGTRTLEALRIEGVMNTDGSVSVGAMSVIPPLAIVDLSHCAALVAAEYPVIGGLSDADALTELIEYTLRIGDELGGELSTSTRHGQRVVPVVSNAAAHQAALDVVAPGHACVVEVEHSRNDLGVFRDIVRDSSEEYRERGYGGMATSIGGIVNVVSVSGERIDSRFWDDVGEGAEVIALDVRIEVLGNDVTVLDGLPLEAVSLAATDAPYDRLIASCRDFPIDPDDLDREPVDHIDGAPSNSVFLEPTPFGDVIGADGIGWRRLYESPHRELYVSEDGGGLIVGRGQDGRWGWAGSGGCGNPALRDPLGLVVAGWRVVESPSPDATTFEIEVNVPICGDDENAGERLLPASIEANDESVTITVLSLPPEETLICNTNPSVEVTVVLDAPLGDRVLLDGSTVPARPVP